MRRARWMAATAIAGVWLTITAAEAATPVKVVDSPAWEFGSAAGGDWLAWSRGQTLGGDYDLYVKQAGQPADVVEPGQYQDVGNIDLGNTTYGDVLIYSVGRRGNDAEIRLYDLATGDVSNPPDGVNTAKDEDNPSISGDHLLFGRGPAEGLFSKRVYLYDIGTTDLTPIAEAPSGGSITANSVRGDYATYTRCPASARCDVFRYQISTGTKVKMPNPGRATYWSSVLDDGTVYFVQGSPAFCGVKTKIMRYVDGTVTKLYRFPDGIEIADLDAVDPVVYFTRINCLRNYRSGIWKIDG